jgi:AmmeMemoRadiSam system protein B
MFYPAGADACRAAAQQLMSRGLQRAQQSLGELKIEERGRRIVGAIVPHAGWVCSGEIAAQSIAALASGAGRDADVIVVFGAVHTPLEIGFAALDTHASWAEPFAQTPVVEEVRAKLIESNRELFAADDRFHRREHAVEVELPLISLAWPKVPVLPVEVPTIDRAPQIGEETARRTLDAGYQRPVFLASSDLTHYGPAYGMAPAGLGLSGLAWARDNDFRLLERVEKFDIAGIVPEASEHLNACGPGAIAAMLAASRAVGATNARVLRHANSYETLSAASVRIDRDATDNAVGYASVIVW